MMNQENASHILIIDDEPAILKLFTMLFLEQGLYNIDTAVSGEEAVEKIKTYNYRLVVTDIKMGGMSGEDVLLFIKSFTDDPIPVIGMSGSAWLLDENLFDAVLLKPFSSTKLFETIGQFLPADKPEKLMGTQGAGRSSPTPYPAPGHSRKPMETEKTAETEQEAVSGDIAGTINRITAELADMNKALQVLLSKSENDRKDVEEKIHANYESLILPLLNRLKKTLTQKEQLNLIQSIESHLQEIFSPFAKNLSEPMTGLSPAEIQIASLIRQGLSNKEIAGTLNKSVRSITAHRESIRRKLGIRNKKVNLRSFLLNC